MKLLRQIQLKVQSKKTDENPTALDPKKAAVAAAIARAKAKKAAAQGETVTTNITEARRKTDENPAVLDPKKAAIAAANCQKLKPKKPPLKQLKKQNNAGKDYV